MFKSKSQDYQTLFSVDKVYKSLFKRQFDRGDYQNEDYLKYRVQLIDFIYQIGQRLRLTQNTTQLAVYLLDRVNIATDVKNEKLNLYAATSLLLAGKNYLNLV